MKIFVGGGFAAFKLKEALTFDLQVDVILVDSEDVSGHAGVFAAVSGLSYIDLQSPVVKHVVRFSIQGA